MSWKAANGWPSSASISTPWGSPSPSGGRSGIVPATASRQRVLGMSRLATSQSPSPRAANSVCGCQDRWSTWPMRNTAATSCRAPRCFPTGPRSGWRVSLAENRSSTPSLGGPGERAVTSLPPGPPHVRPSAWMTNQTPMFGCGVRLPVSISTTATSQLGENAVRGPGNRYPGNGHQGPTTSVTVLCKHPAPEMT